MTFTEAAIEVLRREGKPLHFGKIAEIAVRENLLDHVGKVPEETMAGQLAAHCRLPGADRRMMPVQPGTFALVEWGLEEDPAGLEGLVEPPPEAEPPYRSNERHPVASRELSRGAGREGREGRGRRREEEERRGRKFPPPAEVAYEILAGAGRPLGLAEIAAQGAERLLMPDAFVRDVGSLRAALSEDNRRRESGGRKALFQIDADTVTLVARPEPGERAAVAAPPAARAASTPQELRRAGLAALRRRLRECDGPTLEHVAGALLDKLGFRELKVAKRGREHVVYTARRRMGLADVRHGIRILRGGGDVARRDVGDLRRDLGHYGAQIGIVVSAGDAARDARGDAGAAGQLPIVLLCGEALAEAFADAGVGCVPVVVPDVDEAWFRAAAEAAEQEEAARRARREERDRREGREPREPRDGERRREDREEREPRAAAPAPEAETGAEPGVVEVRAFLEPAAPDAPPAGEPSVAPAAPAGAAEEAEDEGDDEGPDDEGAEPGAKEASPGAPGGEGAEGERRRRRRRRRRRGGRGRGREGAAGEGAPGAAAAAPGAPAEGGPPAGGGPSEGGAPPEPSAPPAPPAPPPTGGEGGS